MKNINVTAATPPEIVKPLKNANCIQYHNAQFTCTIVGSPKPAITWYKGELIYLLYGKIKCVYSDLLKKTIRTRNSSYCYVLSLLMLPLQIAITSMRCYYKNQ